MRTALSSQAMASRVPSLLKTASKTMPSGKRKGTRSGAPGWKPRVVAANTARAARSVNRLHKTACEMRMTQALRRMGASQSKLHARFRENQLKIGGTKHLVTYALVGE